MILYFTKFDVFHIIPSVWGKIDMPNLSGRFYGKEQGGANVTRIRDFLSSE